MDERRLSRAWDAVQQVPTTEWDAAVRVPLCVRKMSAAGETLKHRESVVTPTFSDLRKSFASATSISFTPIFKTIEERGRLCRESV